MLKCLTAWSIGGMKEEMPKICTKGCDRCLGSVLGLAEMPNGHIHYESDQELKDACELELPNDADLPVVPL